MQLKVGTLLAILLIVVLAGTAVIEAQTPTPTPDLGAVYRAFIAALNRGDVAATMTYFTDDAQVTGPPLCTAAPCIGRTAIQGQLQAHAGARLQAAILSMQPAGQTLTVREEHRADVMAAAGVDRA